MLGTGCENVLDAGFAGINTRAGGFATVNFDYRSAAVNRKADRTDVTLHSDQILESRDSVCQVILANSLSFVKGNKTIDVLETIDAAQVSRERP
jgi:hypothetical protein